MILVYCDHITSRHRYIFNFILEDILGVKYDITSDIEAFSLFSGPKFSYGVQSGAGWLHFGSCPLLFETGLKEQDTKISLWEGLPVFYTIEGPSALPFDPFAIAFYLVTRYEEYFNYKADGHGRFPATSSLAFREGFLGIPLVDILASHLKKLILGHFPQAEFPERHFRFIPSFDIDIAFAHLGKGFPRAMAGWIKLVLTGQIEEMKERFRTAMGKVDDPYDNFAWQEDISAMNGYKPIYFALLGNFGRYDRNTSYKNKRFRKLLERISGHSAIGLHPSYNSFLDQEVLLKEKLRLEEITGKPVTSSRFHFLRMKFPESFRILAECGLTDDYSLGYSTHNGFRAGTCTPFCFYDLEREERSGLRLHPFIFMDSAMIDHMNYTPEQAISEAGNLVRQVKECNGEAIGTWHNYALSEKYQYKGWRVALETILKETNTQSL